MTHKDFIYNVQKACQLDASHCSLLLNTLCKVMAQAGVEQIPVVVPGLGKFLSHKHPEYIQEDSQTGLQTLFPPRISYRLYAEEEQIVNTEENTFYTSDVLAEKLAEQSKVSVEESSRFIAALSDGIIKSINSGEEVEVHGIGSFRIVASRQGELQRIAYTPDEQMRSAVNAPFSCFEPVVIKATKETTALIVDDEPVTETIAESEEVVDAAVSDTVNTFAETATTTEEPLVAEEDPAPVSVSEQEPVSVSASEEEPAPVCVSEQEPAPVSVSEQEPVSVSASEQPEEEASPAEENKVEETPAAKNPQAKAEPVSISEHYQEFADEDKKTPLIRLLSVLLILACAALAWFIYKIERPSANPFNRELLENASNPTPAPVDPIEEEGEEIFFGEVEQTSEQTDSVAEDAMLAEAEQAAAEAAEKAEAERIAKEKAAAEKLAAEKEAAEKLAAEKATKEKAAKEDADKTTPTTQKPTSSTISGRLKNADGTYATHVLGQGGRLTLVALEHYGDKAFWPYIFEVNRDKLSDPSLVRTGMVLYLPDPKVFGIDANDPNSIAKAKAKARQYVKQ